MDIITPSSFIQILIDWAFSHGIKVIVILVVVQIISQFGQFFIKRVVRKTINAKDGKESEKKREDTLIGIFNGAFKFSVWIIAITTILPEFGVNIGPLLAGVGLVGLAVGMGARSLIADYLAGIFIVLEDQFRVGDNVEIANITGKVKQITLRRTILKDKQGVIYSIPNGVIKISSTKSKTPAA